MAYNLGLIHLPHLGTLAPGPIISAAEAWGHSLPLFANHQRQPGGPGQYEPAPHPIATGYTPMPAGANETVGVLPGRRNV